VHRFWVLIWLFRVIFTADVIYRMKRHGALKYFFKVRVPPRVATPAMAHVVVAMMGVGSEPCVGMHTHRTTSTC
jgi:hypothetical protein